MQLFVQVCDAVAYAHRNLIVHRDLKPANILVTAQGQVKLLDFGIAKLIDLERPDLTQTAAAPLTPLTAAPEQLLGQPITTATDIYALGLLLFQLLTDTQPWMRAGGPIAQAVRVILDEDLPAPSRRAAETSAPPFPPRVLRGDFDAMVAKAVRKEPQHRYVTVEALKSDVEHALRGDPVAARSGARLYVFGRTLRRYRWVTLAVTAVLVSLAVGLGAAAWQARRAEIERDAARRDAAREEAVRYQLTRLFHTAIEERGAQPATAKAHDRQQCVAGIARISLAAPTAGPDCADAGRPLRSVAGCRGRLGAAEELRETGRPRHRPGCSGRCASEVGQHRAVAGTHGSRRASCSDKPRLSGTNSRRAMPKSAWRVSRSESRLQRATGDLEAASDTATAAIAKRIALSGRIHRETAVLYNSHAITLTAANRLDDALAAYRQTLDIYKALRLDGELDAQIIMGNMGTLEFRTGHLHEAEGLLRMPTSMSARWRATPRRSPR